MTAPVRLVVLAAFTLLTLACAGGGDAARKFMQRGDEYLAAARYDAAVIEYRNAVKKEPTWAEAYTKLGDAYAEQGRSEEAYRAYCNAIDLNPADNHARVEAG